MEDRQQINNSLGQVNRLGGATAHLFSRLYNGLLRRQRQQSPVVDVKQIGERNRQLQRAIKRRDVEIDHLNSILATLDAGIVVQDMEGRIVTVNPAARKLIGSRKEFWESELGNLFNAYRDVTTVDSEITPLGEPSRIHINNMIVGAQLAAVADSKGERWGTMLVLRDITRDALADRLKEQFSTAISHELRTPMAVIKGMSDVIMGQPSDRPPNRKFLETLSRNVDILDRMIVELLDISEMSASAFSVRRDPIDLEDLLWNVVNGMAPEIKKADLDVTVMVRDAAELHVKGDDQRLRWALGHLLQNAIRYTEADGHVIVTASLGSEDQAAIQVIDTGVGISKKDLPHIFDRFYRGEPRTKSGKLLDPRGLGQGLFVARSVAEAHGGYVSVHSEVGQGSVFTIVLPVSPAEGGA
jgi:signal transduction histidine kinase